MTQVIFEQPINPFVAEFMESGNLIAAQYIPKALFPYITNFKDDTSWVLLRENGFTVTNETGLKGLVMDSLYIGYRYRNRIQFDDFSVWIETQKALTPHEQIYLQYAHDALTLQ
jgi:ABC-type Fe3+/spermidine/putrescine transport system ATPase subunit